MRKAYSFLSSQFGSLYVTTCSTSANLTWKSNLFADKLNFLLVSLFSFSSVPLSCIPPHLVVVLSIIAYRRGRVELSAGAYVKGKRSWWYRISDQGTRGGWKRVERDRKRGRTWHNWDIFCNYHS